MTSTAKQREQFEKWLKLQPRCIGYPQCDGDLVAESHSEKCPLFTLPNSAGESDLITPETAFLGGWCAALDSAGVRELREALKKVAFKLEDIPVEELTHAEKKIKSHVESALARAKEGL